MIETEIIRKLNSYFGEKENIAAVYLFGSTVKGADRARSDLDLAVLFDAEPDPFQRFDTKLQIANDLENLLKTEIDVVDLRSADSFFIHQVMLDKVLIYEKDQERRVAFEVKSRREFFDRQRFYDLYHGQVRKRLRERR